MSLRSRACRRRSTRTEQEANVYEAILIMMGRDDLITKVQAAVKRGDGCDSRDVQQWVSYRNRV
jgi:hypothetical protein